MDRNRVQTWASFAEIISALAIVVSLVYAGYQFRRSTTLSSSDAAAVLIERFRESNKLLIESPGLAKIVLAGRARSADLSEADRLRYRTFEKGSSTPGKRPGCTMPTASWTLRPGPIWTTISPSRRSADPPGCGSRFERTSRKSRSGPTWTR